ncbi:hypothetical protein NGRA_3113 [Nosema granulosis]|uniref:CTLH/CRA C-terminal to LisH motif domain-containing protein n=1 Tax=Nosema granulosis TaxID=83296 RepID=A0A9P6GVD5_9MICR|nr:hypothetical protein NGRA_3113 [Nosema granulosis]
MLENDTKRDMQQIIDRIITDHILYSCSLKTLKMWKKNSTQVSPEEIKNMELRKKVLKYIRNKQTDVAFGILCEENVFEMSNQEDKKLFTKLSKLTFVDFVGKDKIECAILFAKQHLDKKKEFEKLYALIGYDRDVLNEEEFKKNCKDIDRECVIKELNSFLFSKLTGRKCSLLHSAVDYHKTLINVTK